MIYVSRIYAAVAVAVYGPHILYGLHNQITEIKLVSRRELRYHNT